MQSAMNQETNLCQDDFSSLWLQFTGAGDVPAYYQSWLSIQCSLVPDLVQGVLVMEDAESEGFSPVAKWPEKQADPQRLADISERVLHERCGLLMELPPPAGAGGFQVIHCAVAYPVMFDGVVHGVVAVETRAGSQEQLKSVMERLQWGVSWLEVLFRRRRMQEDASELARLKSDIDALAGILAERPVTGAGTALVTELTRQTKSVLDRLKSAVDLLACVLAEERFASAGMALVTEIATRLHCDRVSLGFRRGRRVHVRAMSHSAKFGKRMNLIQMIGRAMSEALFQRKEVVYPSPAAEVLITRDHEELSKQNDFESILTVPIYSGGGYLGAMTLERPGDQPFGEAEVDFCRSVSALAFPALKVMRLNDRFLITKMASSFGEQVKRLLGPRYVGRKLIALALAGLAVFLYKTTGEYRIAADTVLEGAVRRVVVTPFRGYVKEAEVRAGDVVREGDVICVLDDRDLHLERLNWMSQRLQLQRQHQASLAEHNRAQLEVINAQLDQINARLKLVESQLERTRIRVPFDGLVISGDLTQRLGGLVEQGEELFEVAPLNDYRLILEVDERRIDDVREGQHGSLMLSALPNVPFGFVVRKITPISTAREGRNYFRVEAQLENVSERMRPGMEGVGKILVDRRKLVSIWTRDLREWMQIWVWSWWPL